MSKFLRLILAQLLFCCSFPSWSAVPITPEKTEYSAAYYGKSSGWKDTAAGACTGVLGASFNNGIEIYTVTASVPGVSDTLCYLTVAYRTAVDSKEFRYTTPIATRTAGAICPDNSVLVPGTKTCACNAGFEEKNGQCVPENNCKFGNTSSSGYYDAGKNTAGGPSIMVCTGGCESIFDGSFPEGSSLVNGEKHYYAKGEYVQTGRQCTGSAESIGQGIPVTEIPPDKCGDGQVMGNVNGKNVCTKASGADTPASKPEDKKDQSSTTKTTTKDKDSEGNDRETTTVVKKNADGSTTTETTTTVTKSNGNGGTTSTTTTNTVTTGGVPGSGGKGESGGKEDGDKESEEKGKCEKNSSDEGCGGTAAGVDGKTFYTAKEKTFSGVLSKASTDLRGSGIGGAFTGFFNVASGGACPVSNWHIPYINADLTFDFMCQPFALDAMLIIKGVLLVIASFMAFRIAFE